MKRYQVIGIALFAAAMSVNIDAAPQRHTESTSSQYQIDQDWRYEQERRVEKRRQAIEQYKDAAAQQKRCLSDYCRQMHGADMNRATEEIYKNN